ncbi:hypothetical protein JCM8547_003062 [Rhodosporidiobolus lusitaniae]
MSVSSHLPRASPPYRGRDGVVHRDLGRREGTIATLWGVMCGAERKRIGQTHEAFVAAEEDERYLFFSMLRSHPDQHHSMLEQVEQLKISTDLKYGRAVERSREAGRVKEETPNTPANEHNYFQAYHDASNAVLTGGRLKYRSILLAKLIQYLEQGLSAAAIEERLVPEEVAKQEIVAGLR